MATALTTQPDASTQNTPPAPVVAKQETPVYSRPTLRTGSENPSGKLGGNACCGNC
jgi:hypothetical protein